MLLLLLLLLLFRLFLLLQLLPLPLLRLVLLLLLLLPSLLSLLSLLSLPLLPPPLPLPPLLLLLLLLPLLASFLPRCSLSQRKKKHKRARCPRRTPGGRDLRRRRPSLTLQNRGRPAVSKAMMAVAQRGDGRGGGAGCYRRIMHGVVRKDNRPSRPYNADTEHAMSRQPGRHCANQARSAVRCSASRSASASYPEPRVHYPFLA